MMQSLLKLEIGSKLIILFPADLIWLFQQITSVTINDENAAFRDFMHKLNEGQKKYTIWTFLALNKSFVIQESLIQWTEWVIGRKSGQKRWRTLLKNWSRKTANGISTKSRRRKWVLSVGEWTKFKTAPYFYFSDEGCKGRRIRTRTTQNYQPISTWLCVSDSIFWIYGLSKFFGISAMIFLESSVHGTRP